MATRKEDEIQIPQNVMRTSNEAFRGLTNAPIPAFPDSASIGASGFSRSMPTSGGGQAMQIASPYGFAQTNLTSQQVGQREQARQQAEQTGTMPRTPEQQQALINQIRQNAPALNQQRTDWVMNTIQQRRENPTAYTTPSGRSVAVPTNRFGQPLESWMNQLGNEGRLEYGPRPAPRTATSIQPRYNNITQPSQYPAREASAMAPQPAQGIRFAPNPSFSVPMPIGGYQPIPMPVVDASGSRIGVTSDFPSTDLNNNRSSSVERFRQRGTQMSPISTGFGNLFPENPSMVFNRRPRRTTSYA